MTNPANVAALRSLIVSWWSVPQTVDLAEWLARHGCLMPSAMTREEAERMLAVASAVVPTRYALGPGPIADELERIARGV